MSAGVVSLEAQVEAVLGSLVKAATVELTKLFESRYRAAAVEAGRTEEQRENESSERLDCSPSGDTKRSIGVQVDICPPLELCEPSFLSDGDCLREWKEVVVEGCLLPTEVFLAEHNVHADPQGSPLRFEVSGNLLHCRSAVEGARTGLVELMAALCGLDVADPLCKVKLSDVKAQHRADGDAQTEVLVHVPAETWTEKSSGGSTRSSPAKQKPLVIQPDTSDTNSEEKVKFVCPLILRSESPAPNPDNSEKPVQAEPQPACVSTAKGTAYSPSPLDGAVTPTQAGVWERIHNPKETKNFLQMKLKLTSPDQKLLRPCAVQLVNLMNQTDAAKAHSAHLKTGWPLPKDLRPHQGVHTGHRLCCFTRCGNGVWRLQKVVTHSRDGYACSICAKTFKRRKILRRHERFHTGEKPYSCSVCSKTFALRKSLRRHVRFHTGERPHTCTQCGKSFRLRDNLKAHLRFHTGEKPFSCDLCGKMFRIMRNMEKHKLSQCESFVPSFRTIAGL